MFRGGCQVFQVGQAPSGPTVIRPLPANRHPVFTGRDALPVTRLPASEHFPRLVAPLVTDTFTESWLLGSAESSWPVEFG